MKLHPGKVRVPTTETTAAFEKARLATEILSDDNRRWAYERFGPIVIEDEEFAMCSKWEEYVVIGNKYHTAWCASCFTAIKSMRLIKVARGARKVRHSVPLLGLLWLNGVDRQ